MDYKITYNPKDQIIETTLRGSITLNDVKGIILKLPCPHAHWISKIKIANIHIRAAIIPIERVLFLENWSSII